MAQAFVTTYEKFHRKFEIERTKSLRPVDKLTETLPEGDIWIVPKKIGENDGEGGHTLESANAAIWKMYRRRLWSTYLMDYSPELVAKVEARPIAKKKENAILLYGATIFGPKTQKIPPPLPNSRRLYGYIRPTRMYNPITTYQAVHDKVGYDILLRNAQPKPADQKDATEKQPDSPENKSKENEAKTKQVVQSTASKKQQHEKSELLSKEAPKGTSLKNTKLEGTCCVCK